MSSYTQPLAALAIRPPAQQDPGEQIQRALQLRALMNQSQYQQQLQPLILQEQQQRAQQQNLQVQMLQKQMQDQQTMTALAPQFTQKDSNGRPIGFDNDGFAAAAQGKGVNPLTINAWRQNQAETTQKLATADKAVRENADAMNGEAYNHLESLRSATDPQARQQVWDAIKPWAQSKGLNTSSWPAAAPDDNWVTNAEAALGMHAQQTADAGKQAETQKNLADAAKNKYQNVDGVLYDISGTKPVPAVGGNMTMADWNNAIDKVIPRGGTMDALNDRTKAQVAMMVFQGNIKGANDAITEAGKQVGSVEKTKYEQAAENTRQSLNRQAQFANTLQKSGLDQMDKMFTDPQHGYTQFLAQAQSTKQAASDARNGNELAASLTPLMTALGVTSFAGVHRINQNEVNAAGQHVGSLYRQANALLDKIGSGTIPADTAKEVQGLVDNLIDAKHQSLIQGANLVAKNTGLDPTKIAVITRDGGTDTLDNVSKQPQAQVQNAKTPQSHSFSVKAWQAANPHGDVEAAKKAAAAQNYTIIP